MCVHVSQEELMVYCRYKLQKTLSPWHDAHLRSRANFSAETRGLVKPSWKHLSAPWPIVLSYKFVHAMRMIFFGADYIFLSQVHLRLCFITWAVAKILHVVRYKARLSHSHSCSLRYVPSSCTVPILHRLTWQPWLQGLFCLRHQDQRAHMVVTSWR